jgi:hypothetical protein
VTIQKPRKAAGAVESIQHGLRGRTLGEAASPQRTIMPTHTQTLLAQRPQFAMHERLARALMMWPGKS